MGSAAKTARSSSKMLRKGVRSLRAMTTQAAANARVSAALRPLAVGLLLGALLVAGVTLLGRLQLWLSGAGVLMIGASVLSAVQEFKAPSQVQSYQDFLDKEMAKNTQAPKVVTVPDAASIQTVAAAAAATKPKKAKGHDQLRPSKVELAAAPLNDVSPALVSKQPVAAAAASPYALEANQKPTSTNNNSSNRRRKSTDLSALEAATAVVPASSARRNSTTAADLSSKLNVLHCGTVIDLQGSHGFIIPHSTSSPRAKPAASVKALSAAGKTPAPARMPLVIPFDLPEAAVLRELAVGKTVEFAFGSDAHALNVTPVASDDELAKTRTALRSCKQARQVSFARAMEELTMISPRNTPVKHHVDLIKYAEQLDDHELGFDQSI